MTRDCAPRLGHLKTALIESRFFPALQVGVRVGVGGWGRGGLRVWACEGWGEERGVGGWMWRLAGGAATQWREGGEMRGLSRIEQGMQRAWAHPPAPAACRLPRCRARAAR